MLPVLPRRLAPVLPNTYSASSLDSLKAEHKARHSELPRHAFAHCEGFAPAASRRTRALVSVPFSGLQLPLPLPIIGLVSRYLTNNLIGRSLILRHKRLRFAAIFKPRSIPTDLAYRGLSSISRGYPRPEGRLTTCY